MPLRPGNKLKRIGYATGCVHQGEIYKVVVVHDTYLCGFGGMHQHGKVNGEAGRKFTFCFIPDSWQQVCDSTPMTEGEEQ